MTKTAFEQYAPFIQKFIYKKGWKDLREVQVEACNAILNTDHNLIIASGTASGKTEAAFFPILTDLYRNPSKSIGVIYISPLKALINDQFERLNDLLREQNIPVWPWHGEVSQMVKRHALKEKKGIIQITPESLEAMLMKHSEDVISLFSDLRFIVIDEIHSLMGTDRGLQVMCLISRLEQTAGCRPRRIGLSATLNDYNPAMNYLSSGSSYGIETVGIGNQKRHLSLCVEHFPIKEDSHENEKESKRCIEFLYDITKNKKSLIFANSRNEVEKIIFALKKIAKKRNEKDIFFAHHGSISASLRQETEHTLRDSNGPVVAAATLTLELGIDIGDLDTTVQIGAPYSCSSFVQRLGRSGRRSGKSQMLFIERAHEPTAHYFDSIDWELLQTIAVIQQYVEKKWVEPFELKKKPFSLLAHQTLSTVMAYGEIQPSELARKVIGIPFFQNSIALEEYKELLRYMLQIDILQRIDHGGLIAGLIGEKIANYYTFYAVFADVQNYRVFSDSGEIGSIYRPPEIGQIFMLAGKSWKVKSVDEYKRTVYVVRAKTAKKTNWRANGFVIVHEEIVKKMKMILLGDDEYSYLTKDSAEILHKMRILSREQGILNKDIICGKDNTIYFCPWCGTKQLQTIYALFSGSEKERLKINEITKKMFYLEIRSELSLTEFAEECRKTVVDKKSVDELTKNIQLDYDKYDYMVPENLKKIAYINNILDIPGAVNILKTLVY